MGEGYGKTYRSIKLVWDGQTFESAMNALKIYAEKELVKNPNIIPVRESRCELIYTKDKDIIVFKTSDELLELYAEAYKIRKVDIIKDYIPSVVQYSPKTKFPNLMTKNSFLKYLQEKFDGQNGQIPIENEEISIVYNETTKKQNILIDSGDQKNGKILIEITTDKGKLETISILESKEYLLKQIKIILNRTAKSTSIPAKIINPLQKSEKFNYFEPGIIFLTEDDDPKEAIDTIINTNYPFEYCWGENFKPLFLSRLILEGFYIMSRRTRKNDGTVSYLMQAMHHLSRSILFFDNIKTTKTVKRLLNKYELKPFDNIEMIIDKCVEIHGSEWLSPMLVQSMKEIAKADDPKVTFIAFGLYMEGKLVAGDFGTLVGRIYSSYSGFHLESNSGSVQMILTAKYLERNGFAFWDLGMPLKYKSDLGAKTINLEYFTQLWRKYSSENFSKGLDFEHLPTTRNDLNTEELLTIFKNAYKYFYIDDLVDYMDDDFHYSSMHVFDEITSKRQYIEYLFGKVKKIQAAEPPMNMLEFEIVYDTNTDKPYLFMRQGANEALFVPKIKDGKFERIDLCIPSLYKFKRK
jgi:Leu/Phe-tRNA-protein transferase